MIMCSKIPNVTIGILVLLIITPSAGAQEQDDDLNLSEKILPVTDSNVFRDHNYYNWGCSIIKSEDGKYHLFYSRWPREYGFYSWLTHSEIAHAVSEKPEGPYSYVETVIRGRGHGPWDAITAHNPKIKYFEGKYYLYYIGTHSDEKVLTDNELIETAKTGYSHPSWSVLRKNQRTGVAIATSLYGPWKKLDHPVVEPAGPITTLTVNPAICRGPDETYFMIVKGDKPNEERFIRNQALAISKTPEGPFKIELKAVIDNMDTEDASMWYDPIRNRFYAVFHAHNYIGMITSGDGYTWENAKYNEITTKRILFADGSILKPDRMERPFIYIEKNNPMILAVAVKKGNDSYTIFIPLGE